MPRPNDERDLRDLSQSLQPIAGKAIDFFNQLSRPAQAGVIGLILIGMILVAWLYYHAQVNPSLPEGPPAQVTGSPHLLLGNPSNAAADRDNYLMVKPYFALSYNSACGTPNWVSWRVIGSDLGSAPRAPEFSPDDTLPAGWVRIVHRDYSGSGFDRGHMCPHSDRAFDQTSSYATFVMTNIIPQAPNVNQKAWAQVEQYCRELVRSHHRLYITSGPAGRGGIGRFGFRDTIADGKVVVPRECWKIIVILPDTGSDPDPAMIPDTTRVLSVDMPNDETTVGESWKQYRVSPDQIEQKTHLHFFDRLRPDVAAKLRMRIDTDPVPEPRLAEHESD